MSGWVRPAAVAGYFYPGDARSLRRAVTALVDAAGATRDADAAGGDRPPKAIIAPHAGYRYSGPVAATAYAALAPAAGRLRRVILAGPAHRTRVDGVAVSSADAFASPLGAVPVDDAARRLLLENDAVVVDDTAHADEHSLEVHLPFITTVLGDVTVLPLLVQSPGAAALADVLDTVWDSDETGIVISTDLSHYHDDATAHVLDRSTAARICNLEPPGPDAACGAAAVHAMLLAAGRHDLTVRLLDLRTSADTAGDPDRVVGYGAFAIGHG